ncbi:DUF4097 family beta strand repeat-containing protein [Amycolatopsis sp. lyj-112]|uniref:DUF4097 family beta strand repeat-containing protein n=1 Tax=Amycolatopsis sp. lyj-112 TaxID=2789288 RepID=UPI00397E0E06
MPSFPTPVPILVLVEVAAGDIRVVASDRADTVVVVGPSDEANGADITAAELTVVELTESELLIKAPKAFGLFGKAGSIAVRVEVPSGSPVRGETAAATFQGEGRLGDCEVKTSSGDIRLQRTGSLKVTSGSGDVVVGSAAGPVAIATASGNVRIGELGRGRVVLNTATGALDVGIREDAAAHFDVATRHGTVRNDFKNGDGDERVEVRGRTSTGDIVIHQAFRESAEASAAGGGS